MPEGSKIKLKPQRLKRYYTEGGMSMSRYSEVTGSSCNLPPEMRSRLNDLFGQIEHEFEQLYNACGHPNALQDKMNQGDSVGLENVCPSTDSAVNPDTPNKNSKMKGSGAQLGRRLKTTYKVSAGKLVSSFKATAGSSAGCQYLRSYSGHKDGVWEVVVSSSGSPVLGSASADRTARIWCINPAQCLLEYHGHSGSVNSIRFHPTEAGCVLTSSGDKQIHLWKFNDSMVQDFRCRKAEEGPPEEELYLDDDDGLRDSFDHPQGSEMAHKSVQPPHPASTASGPIYHDHQHEEPVSVVKTPTFQYKGHQNVVCAASFLSDGTQLVSASWDRTANLYDLERSEPLQTLTGHDKELNNVSCHPAQKLVVTASCDATFRLYDFRDNTQCVKVFQGHNRSLTTAIFATEDKIISSSDDQTCKIWDVRNMRTPMVVIRVESAVNRLAVSRGVIVLPMDNRHVRLYDVNGQRLARLPRTSQKGHHRMVCCATWTDENAASNLFTCAFDRQLIGWKVNLNAIYHQ